MRLFDKLRHQGVSRMAPLFEMVEPHAERSVLNVTKALLNSTVIVADNVTKYYFEGSTKEQWLLTRDFPNLAPPLPFMFIETKAPKRVVTEARTISWREEYLKIDSWGIVLSGMHPEKIKDLRQADVLPDCKWYLQAALFMEWGGELVGPSAYGMFQIDGQGRYIKEPDDLICVAHWSRFYDPHNPKYKMWVETALELMKPLLLAVCFMHCKNVKREVIVPTEEQQKKHRKKRKADKPLVKYEVLDITPFREVAIRAHGGGASNEPHAQRAMHICRGHFANYTQDKPLFGRTTGMVWRPQHVRGKDHAHQVVKDYRVDNSKGKAQ